MMSWKLQREFTKLLLNEMKLPEGYSNKELSEQFPMLFIEKVPKKLPGKLRKTAKRIPNKTPKELAD